LGIVLAVWEYKQCSTCKDWPKTEGVIVRSKVIEIGDIWKQKMLVIAFEYGIDGKKYRSQRIQNRFIRPRQTEVVEALLEKYPLDKKVIVSYHPKIKRNGIVETKCKNPQHIVWFGLVLSLVLMLSLLILKFPDILF